MMKGGYAMAESIRSINPAAHDDSTSLSSRATDSLVESGFVHTLEARIPHRNGIDVVTPRRGVQWLRCGENCSKGRAACVKFNPNHIEECSSLSELEARITAWANSNDFEREDLTASRIDFTIDYVDDGQADLFEKLCHALICCHIIKHETPLKGQYRGFGVIKRTSKNCKSTDSHGPTELEIYDKKTQLPSLGVRWRFEIRFIRSFARKSDAQNYREMLLALRDELKSLVDFYGAAQTALNDALVEEFLELQSNSEKKLSPYQFLLMNNDRVFRRTQCRDFMKKLFPDADESSINSFVKHFPERYTHLFIEEHKLRKFVDDLANQIDQYTNRGVSSETKIKKYAPDDLSWLHSI